MERSVAYYVVSLFLFIGVILGDLAALLLFLYFSYKIFDVMPVSKRDDDTDDPSNRFTRKY